MCGVIAIAVKAVGQEGGCKRGMPGWNRQTPIVILHIACYIYLPFTDRLILLHELWTIAKAVSPLTWSRHQCARTARRQSIPTAPRTPRSSPPFVVHVNAVCCVAQELIVQTCNAQQAVRLPSRLASRQ